MLVQWLVWFNSWAYVTIRLCTNMSNICWNQLRVFLELKLQAPRGQQWQWGVCFFLALSALRAPPSVKVKISLLKNKDVPTRSSFTSASFQHQACDISLLVVSYFLILIFLTLQLFNLQCFALVFFRVFVICFLFPCWSLTYKQVK